MRVRTTILTAAGLLGLVPLLLTADGLRDTLSYFDPSSASAFYRTPGLTAQAARFDLAAPAYVRRVTLWLSGPEGTTADIRLYGNEASLAAPLADLPITRSFTVRKQRNGVEKIHVNLPTDLLVERPQFFVVLSDLSTGLRWLSDRTVREPFCVDGIDRWSYQAIRSADGTWAIGRHAFAIEAVVDFPERPAPGYLARLADDSGLPIEPVRNRSIAWSDVDGDTRTDLLVDGRLFLNRGDDRFEEVTEDAGLPIEETPRAHFFIDVDNDRDVDILAIGYPDGSMRLLRNDGAGVFSQESQPTLEHFDPASFSIADADGDGYLDVVLAQQVDSTGAVRPALLLKNDRGTGFRAEPLTSMPLDSPISSIEWIRANGDDAPDLGVSFFSGSEPITLVNDGSGRLAPADPSLAAASIAIPTEAGGAIGVKGGAADWIEEEGRTDALQPKRLDPSEVRAGKAATTGVVRSGPDPEHPIDHLPFDAFSGAALRADVDNDGRLDALLTSTCDCRYATLYAQEAPNTYEDRSFAFGLFRLPAGSDAVWVDYDADGLLDLATFVGDRFVLLKNTLHSSANFVEIDAGRSPEPGATTTGTVTVYTGSTTITRVIGSGRGMLMQEPPVVHLGLGAISEIDSIVYRPLSGDPRVLVSPEINKVHRLFDDRAPLAAADRYAVSVVPNPFRARLTFSFDLAESADVRIEIYGIDGTLLATPLTDRLAVGTHTVDWLARAADGSQLPAGTYVWRAYIGTRTLTGRSVLAR